MWNEVADNLRDNLFLTLGFDLHVSEQKLERIDGHWCVDASIFGCQTSFRAEFMEDPEDLEWTFKSEEDWYILEELPSTLFPFLLDAMEEWKTRANDINDQMSNVFIIRCELEDLLHQLLIDPSDQEARIRAERLLKHDG